MIGLDSWSLPESSSAIPRRPLYHINPKKRTKHVSNLNNDI